MLPTAADGREGAAGRSSCGTESGICVTCPRVNGAERVMEESELIKLDLHIHTLDDQKDALDYTSHQLLERAKALGFGVLAITLHDSVFQRAEVFADAAAMGILLIP